MQVGHAWRQRDQRMPLIGARMICACSVKEHALRRGGKQHSATLFLGDARQPTMIMAVISAMKI